MSATELAKQLFDGLKAVKDVAHAMAPGLKDFGPEMKAEFTRLGIQGQNELAGALFNGSGFVPYGPGQYTPTPDRGPDHGPEHQEQMEHSHELSRER